MTRASPSGTEEKRQKGRTLIDGGRKLGRGVQTEGMMEAVSFVGGVGAGGAEDVRRAPRTARRCCSRAGGRVSVPLHPRVRGRPVAPLCAVEKKASPSSPPSSLPAQSQSPAAHAPGSPQTLPPPPFEADRLPRPIHPEYPAPVPIPECAELQRRHRQCRSVGEVWASVVELHGDRTAIIDPQHGKEPLSINYRQWIERVEQSAAALRRAGIQRGDHIALFSENSLNWLLVDQGLMRIGAVSAVRGASAAESELKYIYEHAECVALVVENAKVLKRVMERLDVGAAPPRFVLLLKGGARDDAAVAEFADRSGVAVYDFASFMSLAEGASEAERAVDAAPDDIATILYTSGTTAMPKGVPLTHTNLLYQLGCVSIGETHPSPGDLFLSVLPCWHIFERTIEYIALSCGATLVYSSVRTLRADLQHYRPTHLVAVPRLLEGLYSNVMKKVQDGGAARRAVFQLASSLSREYVRNRDEQRGLVLPASMADESPPERGDGALRSLQRSACQLGGAPLYALADRLVWSGVRLALGGRLKVAVCGGGSLPRYMEEFFQMARVPVVVGYGLTETSPVIANRSRERNVGGSVGLPPPGTELKIVSVAGDGDGDGDGNGNGNGVRCRVAPGQVGVLYAKGPSVLRRYYRDEAATAEAFDGEGFFDTGDLAWMSPSGDVVITGRQKETIVLSNGENIAPQSVEDVLLASPHVRQAMICGQDRRFLTLLLVPELDALLADELIDERLHRAATQAAKSGTETEIRKMEAELGEKLRESLLETLRGAVREMPSYQPLYDIKQLEVVLRAFSVEDGLMTQTLKLKKNVIAERYKHKIDGMYS